jgi:hypothetical protein
LLTWRYYYDRGSGRRDRLSSQDLARGSLDVVERRGKVLVKENYQVHLSSRMEHSGQMQGGRDLNKPCSTMRFRDYFGKVALYSLSYERSLPPSEKSILHNTYYM